jgi:hypothetical protein
MPKTRSILDEGSWRKHYGWLLGEFSDSQDIKASAIGKTLDAIPTSLGRNRLPDWSHYKKGSRIPTERQLVLLADALRVPYFVLRLATGYVDETLAACYAAAVNDEVHGWTHKVRPRRAALGLLFSLFSNEDMHIDNRWTLGGLMVGTTIRLNIVQEEGFLTGHDWNATWLYPEVFTAEMLRYDNFDPQVQYLGADPKTSQLVVLDITEETYVPNVTIRAEAQIDVASPIANSILSADYGEIPRSTSFAEAQRILHAKALPLSMRIDHAGDIFHLWADELDRAMAEEVREHLQQWDRRSLTQEAAQWVRGEIAKKPKKFWL